MKITLSPQRRDDALTVYRTGDVLTINGEAIDLATYDAQTAPCAWIVGEPLKGPEGWSVTLLLPHGPIPWPAPAEALAVTEPAPIVLTQDGPVALPVWVVPIEGG